MELQQFIFRFVLSISYHARRQYLVNNHIFTFDMEDNRQFAVADGHGCSIFVKAQGH